MATRGPNPGNLVSRDRHADPCAADQYTAISLPRSDSFRQGNGDIRVVDDIMISVAPNINHGVSQAPQEG